VADQFLDGNVRVAFVPAIANINAPTTTELNAGTLLQSLLTADGLMNFKATTSTVDTTSIASTFNTKTIGRDDFGDTGLRLKKQNYGSDTVFSLLTRGTAGFIVIRRGVAETTAWASSQAVQVYPITCGQTGFVDYEPNSLDRWEVQTPITATPSLRAAVA
jgi:hypothetical protein